jgi:hypothetical protein
MRRRRSDRSPEARLTVGGNKVDLVTDPEDVWSSDTDGKVRFDVRHRDPTADEKQGCPGDPEGSSR